MKINYKNLIAYSDLGGCSALITAGFELMDIDNTNPKRVRFFFDASKSVEQTLERYWSPEGLDVNAREYFQNLRVLKSQIYNTSPGRFRL